MRLLTNKLVIARVFVYTLDPINMNECVSKLQNFSGELII